MSPEDQMRRFQQAMEHTREAYTSLTKVFNKENKVFNMWEGYCHMQKAIEAIGQEYLQDVLRECEALPTPPPTPPAQVGEPKNIILLPKP